MGGNATFLDRAEEACGDEGDQAHDGSLANGCIKTLRSCCVKGLAFKGFCVSVCCRNSCNPPVTADGDREIDSLRHAENPGLAYDYTNKGNLVAVMNQTLTIEDRSGRDIVDADLKPSVELMASVRYRF